MNLVEAPAVVAGAVLRTRRRVNAAVAGRDVAREVLFDGHQTRKRDFVGEIGHAESAGAQHPLDAVVTDQFGPTWQRDEIRHGSP